MRDFKTPVLIVGGGTGGVAAALACARSGTACVIVEPTAWVGGQLTSQGVPPDEHRWIEGDGPGAPAGFTGSTASYAEMRRRVREHCVRDESMTAAARSAAQLNPGNGWVSRLCAPPRVFHAALEQMLAPHVASGLVRVVLHAEPVGADVDGNDVRSVMFADVRTGERFTAQATLFLEATELGDLLELAGVESMIGAESQQVFGELHGRPDLPAGTTHDQRDQQAFSWCFAIEHRPGEDHTIERPPAYDAWRSYVPEMSPPWTGPLFSWTVPSHDAQEGRELAMTPWPDEPASGAWELWRYRRIVDAAAHTDGRPDVCLVNWVQMDHWRSVLLGASRAERREAFEAAREQSRCLLYWMQTESPRHDGGAGYPGLRMRDHELGRGSEAATGGEGFALAPYIREPRRLDALRVLHEGDLGEQQRAERGVAHAECFADSIAIGHYAIDLHPTAAGRNNVYVPALPFRVPLRALVPKRVRNVIGAGKAFGVSHVANGCTRLHPVEWAIGEAAGLLASRVLAEGIDAHTVANDRARAAAFRERCEAQGMPTRWPWEPEGT
ncbi:MAG: FAD-dependent oxidoreductase [Planctomycetota bacterium]